MEADKMESRRLEICRVMNKDLNDDVYCERGYYIMEDAFDSINALVLSIIKECEGD